MSADLAIGVKVGFSAGAAIAGLTSLGRSMDKLGAETQKLTACADVAWWFGWSCAGGVCAAVG